MSTDSADSALRFDHVVRRYGDRIALDDVTFSVPPGQFVALVGASGSGKSSLLRLVNRLDRPDGGQVRVNGQDGAETDPIRLRRGIGYVFQNIGLFPHMSVAENIAIIPRLGGGAAVDVAAALARVGLPADYAGRLPSQLSGGEQQRVGIARALAGGGRILLLDEPFGALDPVTRDTLGRTVRALHDELGLTTLMVTHDMAEALLLADRIVVMAAGRLVGDATPSDMLAGRAGAEADALVAVPREQAARLAALGR